MLFAMSIGFLSAIVVLIVQARLGLRKFMGYPAVMDAAVTLLIAWLLHGTFAGMTAAAFGGLFYSLMITVIRKFYGYERLTMRGWVVHDGLVVANSKQLVTTIKQRSQQCLNLNSSMVLPVCIGVCLILVSAL